MNNEEWKPIENYEGFYEISNMGRVRSLDRTVYFKNSDKPRKCIGKIMTPVYWKGYQKLRLHKNNNYESVKIHRLVAKHFVSNPENKNVVNHIDGIKSNNKSSNLEWCTPKENTIHALENGKMQNSINAMMEYNISNRKKIALIKNNKILKTCDSSRFLAEYMLQENLVENVTIETLSRNIRRRANNGKLYKNFHYSFIED